MKHLHSGSATGWLRVLMVISVVAPVLVVSLLAWSNYVEEMGEARRNTNPIARIAEEHALKILETSEVIMRRTRELLRDDTDELIRAREKELHFELQAITHDLPQVHSATAWDSEGRGLAADRFYPMPRNTSVADRDYFLAQKDGTGATFISPPYKGRIDDFDFFSISGRRENGSHEFAGIVAVSLSPRYFSDFYREVAKAHGGTLSIALFKSDGRVIASYPDSPRPTTFSTAGHLMRAVARSEQEGIIEQTSQIDGQARLVVFRKLEHYPIFVAVGVPHASILSMWRRNVAVWVSFGFLAGMGLLLTSWTALRKTEREQTAMRRWHEEAAHRALAEAELRQAQKLESLGQLTGGLAHDVNNLLGIIRNNAYALQLKPDMADASERFAAIERAVSSGQNLTQRLLSFVRKEPLKRMSIDIRNSVSNVCGLLKHCLPSNITLHCEVSPGTWPIEADARELELAILNMSLNSRDAMPKGGVLAIRACNAGPTAAEVALDVRPAEFVEISISDTGDGIPQEILAHVFDPFFTTKPVGKGTGLGLSQVYEFAKRAGGTVTIKSDPSDGTTVTVQLPRAAGSTSTADCIVQIRDLGKERAT